MASPFLPSDPKDFPRLARVDVLDAAKAEFYQQLEHSSIELPVDRYRANGKLRQWKPSPGCPHAFKCAYSAFCSARRTMCACTTSEGELLFSSETAELLAHAQQLRSPFGSLLPRPLAVSLVVPQDARRSSSSLAFIDGIATLSETKTESGLPATTRVRYSIYGGEATASIERALAHDAFDRRSVQAHFEQVAVNDTILVLHKKRQKPKSPNKSIYKNVYKKKKNSKFWKAQFTNSEGKTQALKGKFKTEKEAAVAVAFASKFGINALVVAPDHCQHGSFGSSI